METLRNFGFVEPIREGRLVLDYEGGIVNSEVFNALQYGGVAWKEVGKRELGSDCEMEARKMFGIITGDCEGVERAFKGDEGST